MKRRLLLLILLSLVISLIYKTPLKASEIDSISSEEGIAVGDIIYTYDEQGNMIETVVSADNAISEEEAEMEYYNKFIGSGDELNETSEFIIYNEDITLTNISIEKDVYIEDDVLVNTTETVKIEGNLYIFGTLKNTGNLTVTGTIYCLNYNDQSAGEYDNGYLINDNGTIICDNIYVDDTYLDNGIPVIITYDLISIDENGNETIIEQYELYTDALSAYDNIIIEDPSTNYAIKSQDEYWMIKYGIVVFKKIYATNSSGTQYIKTTSYTNANTSALGYLHVSYGSDAAYLESVNDQVKFKIAGVIGLVDPTLVDIIPYSKNVTYINKYQISNGNIYHYIKDNDSTIDSSKYPSLTNIGKAPSYLKENTIYYSYDAHYFYEDYFKMIDDYRNDNYNNAINKDEPYYNYYQYLPLHSKTNYTIEEINNYIATKYSSKPTSNVYSELTNKQSLLYGEGESFINGNEVAVNPLLTLGVAINESGWGRSRIAITKNNLFGLNAIDSSAQESADTYESIAQCIEVFMMQYVTHGYLDTKNDSRYYGGHLGDKESGMNVSYASDPYWGEKAASHCYILDNALGNKDYQYYSLGIKETITSINIYKEMDLSSDVIYEMTNEYTNINIKNMPVILVEISEDKEWYKIYTDHLLDENQNRIYRNNNQTITWLYSQIYSFINSFGYISSSSITKLNEGTYIENFEETPSEPSITYEEVDEIVYATDNVNIRKGPDTTYEKLGLLYKDESIQRIGIGSNGWSKVIYNENEAYIKSAYLTTTKPIEEKPYDIKTYLENAHLTVIDKYVYGINDSNKMDIVIDNLSKVDPNVKIEIDENQYQNSNNYVTTNMKLMIYTPDNQTYEYIIIVKGDVNSDGYISSKDYNAIKNHITGKNTLKDSGLIVGDVNSDGYISSKDYNAIKNHITGKKKLY